mmetsp:Transcript_416/g.938  ORF Transcript_416/g.938 Transcript_416/m.938 type:complete len:285 (-) Transcript_416:130-984(-)
MILWLGSARSSSMTAASAVNWSGRDTTRDCCGTCWCVACSSPTQSTNWWSADSATLMMERRSSGIVALKTSVWNCSLRGSFFMICRMAGWKPMSSSWSPSSNTSTERRVSSGASELFSRWSFRRPGVATRMSGVRCVNSLMSRLTFVPPYMTWMRKPAWKRSSRAPSSAICCASSRVGLSTSALTAPRRCAGGMAARRSSVGIRNASVLPVPVLAFTSTSAPVRQCGIAFTCTRDIVSYPNSSSMDCSVAAATGSSEKRLSLNCAVLLPAPPTAGRGACWGGAP